MATLEVMAASSDIREISARQLVVLFDSSGPTPRDILATIRDPGSGADLYDKLGRPSAARWPMDGLTSPRLKAELAKNPESPRARLESYVVLTYADVTSANVARKQLQQDPGIRYVGSSLYLQPAATTPNDTYFSVNPSSPYPGNYQWGMQSLNLPKAWDGIAGTAYIGVVDHGIYCSSASGGVCTAHSDLRQNFRNQFSKNFNGGTTVDELSGETNAIAGHGTHVAGIVAANPNDAQGVSGACFSCSLAIVKIANGTGGSLHDAITFAVDSGMQIINFSGADDLGVPPYYNQQQTCNAGDNYSNGYLPFCDAIAYAKANDVVFVAASGNDYNYKERLGFPALNKETIAVGGIRSGDYFWDDGNLGNCTPASPQAGSQCGSNWGSQQDVWTLAAGPAQIVAPATNVVSTMYPNKSWNTLIYCSDTFAQTSANGNPVTGQLMSGWGDCRGTSMAAPHVSGIAGLVRSANPLLSRDQVKSILLDSSNTRACTGSNFRCGAGIPDAAKDVKAALGGIAVVNRLTPLFSFFSADRGDHLYTVVPQMGTAAIVGQLLPRSYTGNHKVYASIGPLATALSWFPGVPDTSCGFSPPCTDFYPRAMISVFTTPKNPYGGPALLPLYRLSWPCPNGTDPSCGNHEHVSHVYATDTTGSEHWVGGGYSIDGIEGYIFPKSVSQPVGTVKVCRKYDPGNDDYILFPGAGASGTDCSAATDSYTPGGSNYTSSVYGTDWIGWAYPAQSSRAFYAASGFLSILFGDD